DRTDEFKDAENHPGFARQRTKGLDLRAYLVEHEDLHGARRSVQERGEDLQDPQQDVHRVPPPGFRVGARRAVSPRAIHVLSPDVVTTVMLTAPTANHAASAYRRGALSRRLPNTD